MLTDSSTVMPAHDATVKILKSKDSSMPAMQKKGSAMTLILKPYNSTFQIRTLELKEKTKIRIGRQTSSKTLPTPFNGFFDSKVLSRQHAELWCENSKIYIKDVKSSNGTFVNGERLSNECEESEPKELNNDDEIEFGIDIVNENGSILYHKVSCTVYIFSMPLSQVDESIIKELSNAPNRAYPSPHLLVRKSSVSSVSTVSSANSDMTSNTSIAMAATGGNTGKRSKKLESVLTKLQSEVDKSRKVEEELKVVRDAVGNLNKVLSEDRIKENDELQLKLNQAETKIRAFDEKWRYQNQAIQTAKTELHRLEKELSNRETLWKVEKENLTQEVAVERKKAKDLEVQLNKLSSISNKHQSRNIQLIAAVLIATLSVLFYKYSLQTNV